MKGRRHSLYLSLLFLCLISFFVLNSEAKRLSIPGWMLQETGKYITATAIDQKGRLWVGTEDNGISVLYEDKSKTFGQDVLGEKSCTALAVSKGQAVWIGTIRNGLRVIADNKLKKIGILEGLPGMHIYALTPDLKYDNAVWCATDQGLCHVLLDAAGTIKIDNIKDISSSGSTALKEIATLTTSSKGNILWAGSLIGGISRWDGKNWKTYKISSNSVDGQINTFLVDKKNRLWAATKTGLLVFASGSWRNVADEKADKAGIKDPYILSICEDTNGLLWVGTRRHGLYTYEPESQTWKKSDKQPPDWFISTLCCDPDGFIWAGTYGKGLVQIELE